jgi:hypothetical protein
MRFGYTNGREKPSGKQGAGLGVQKCNAPSSDPSRTGRGSGYSVVVLGIVDRTHDGLFLVRRVQHQGVNDGRDRFEQVGSGTPIVAGHAVFKMPRGISAGLRRRFSIAC